MAKRVFILFICSIFLSGCFLFPKKAALENVHDIYIGEFLAMETGQDSQSVHEKSACSTVNSGNVFPKTLKEIRVFEEKYPGLDVENVHLMVLRGMIYIQSGSYNMAAIVNDELNAVSSSNQTMKSKLMAGTRDKLFADNMDYLITGWREICGKASQEENNINPGVTIIKWDAQLLLDKAKEISGEEGGPSLKNPNEMFSFSLSKNANSGKADGGAIYLAATAAIFYEWANDIYKNRSDLAEKNCKSGVPDINQTNECLLSKKVCYIGKAYSVLEPFFTKYEIAALKEKLSDSSVEFISEPGRLRYLHQLYEYAKIIKKEHSANDLSQSQLSGLCI